MAGKRTADRDLNHLNWDREDDPEDAGSFSKASDDVLKKRVIKVAKRRAPIASPSNSEDRPSVFASFGGFKKPAASVPTSSAFGFLSNLSKESPKKEEGIKTNGVAAPSKTETPPATLFQMPDNKKNDLKSDEYYAKLKGLNEGVSSWIKKHVDSNPFLNLKPIFCDYEKHFNSLEETYKQDCNSEKSTEKEDTDKTNDSKLAKDSSGFAGLSFKPTTASGITTAPSSTIISTVPTTSTSSFSWNNPQPSSSSGFTFGSESKNKGFTFGNSEPNKEPFKFGTNSATSGITFGNSSSETIPFTFTKKPPEQPSQKQIEEEDDEPPKVEFTPVVEEGHIYTIRCKVFIRKDGQFGERGVGNLYLKPVPDTDKVQLIVRADTSLGNLLCNFILSANIPMQRMGQKDVMLATLPTPDSKPPPVPLLLRVKSREEADELLETLEKHKK